MSSAVKQPIKNPESKNCTTGMKRKQEGKLQSRMGLLQNQILK
jgi:hypothetical protein